MGSIRITPGKQQNNRGGSQASGIVLLIFCGVILLCLLTGGFPLGGLGVFLKVFFEGLFGVTAYALSLGGILMGYLLLTKRRITLPKRYTRSLIWLFLSFVMILHLSTTSAMLLEASDWGGYIMSCYDVSGNILSGGGVLAGVVMYPIAKLTGILGTYILLILIVFACFMVLTNFAVLKLFQKERPVREKNKTTSPKIRIRKREEGDLPVYWAKKVSANSAHEKSYEEDRPIIKEVREGDKYFTNLKSAVAAEDKEERENAKAKLYPAKKSSSPYQIFNIQNPEVKQNPSDSYIKRYEQSVSSHKTLFDKFQEKEVEDRSEYFKRDIGITPSQNRRPTIVIHNPPENSGSKNDIPQYSLKPNQNEEEKPPKKSPSEYSEFFSNKHTEDSESRQPIINGEEFGRNQLKKQMEQGQPKISPKQQESKTVPLKPVEQLKPPVITPSEQTAEEKKTPPVDMVNEFLEEPTPEEQSRAEETAISIIKPFVSKAPHSEQIGLRLPNEPQEVLGTPKTRHAKYKVPPIELLNHVLPDPDHEPEDYEANKVLLENTLNEFKINAKVTGIVCGPTVTRYELEMAPGIPVKRVNSVADDIAMRLSAVGGIRIEAPIPGRNLFGIEVPNTKKALVSLRSIIESEEFRHNKHLLTFALGKDIGGANIVQDLADMPHLLIAGSTNTGKSVCLNSLIVSMLYKYSPEELRLILVDPKQVEFSMYNEMPHLMLKEVVTTIDKAMNSFNWLVGEMERRYKLFKANFVPGIKEYNKKVEEEGEYEKLPRIVLIVDELNDLMMNNKSEVESRFMRLAQMARAAGIHLVFATQRPSVDVLTGTIKANLPCRIALRVISAHDSKTILDQGGPEKLIGKGDMLLKTGNMSEPLRLQGAYVSLPEVKAVVDFIKSHNESNFDETVEKKICKSEEGGSDEEGDFDRDALFISALKYVIEAKSASIAMIQRRFSVGYARAGKIVDEMEKQGFISGFEGSKARQILLSMEEFNQRFGGND